MIEFTLPFPPSVNRLWRNVGNKTLLSAEGREYRKQAAYALLEQRVPCTRMNGCIHVSIVAYPPDKRRRDIDNLTKAALDSLTHSGVIEDDSFIDKLEILRGPVKQGGELKLTVEQWVDL